MVLEKRLRRIVTVAKMQFTLFLRGSIVMC